MKAINNWADVKPASEGFQILPAGGYICKIEACKEKTNKSNNGTHLEIQFDVAEGEYTGFFAQDWQSQTREDKFWRGVINQNVPNESSAKYDQQCGFFKRFTGTVEESNPGYHWDWNEADLAGKKIGVVFGEEERESSNGTRYMTSRADRIVTVEAIRAGKFTVPAVKRLNQQAAPAGTFQPVDGDDPNLPF